ncbi:MAG: hypothetical protein RIS24_1794, partial [Verrucomicrobiota bacterium]
NEVRSVVTYTWREDITPPVLRNLPLGGELGCNPTLPTCSTSVTATDNCDGDVSGSVVCIPGQIVEINGCLRSQSFTYIARDTCTNEVRSVVRWSPTLGPKTHSRLASNAPL